MFLPVRNCKDAISEPVYKLPSKLLAVVFCEVVSLIFSQPIIDPPIDKAIRLGSYTSDLATKCTRTAGCVITYVSEKMLNLQSFCFIFIVMWHFCSVAY